MLFQKQKEKPEPIQDLRIFNLLKFKIFNILRIFLKIEKKASVHLNNYW